MMKKLVMMSCALVAFEAMARTFGLTVWRGETTAARVPDFCELGAAPDGIGVRVGSLLPVKYAPQPDSLQRLEVLDRVSWTESAGVSRVVEVSVPRETKAGTYRCGMMEITVLDRELPPPADWRYYLDLWQHPWAVARMAKAKPFSPEHYAAMRPVYELLASAGQKTITVSLLDFPWDHQCADAYRSMFADDTFALFDEYVSFCLDCGLGPDISCYSLCPWTLGRTIDVEALESRWGAFLERFAAHVKEKGWFEHTYMAMDERSPEDVRKVSDFVNRHAPGMRISMAGNRKPSDFEGITIDSYAQVLFASCLTPEFLREAADRRAKGLVTTFYVCCSPAHPNTFMDSGVGEPFWCGAAPAFLGLDGLLRWAWNSWPADPAKDASFGNWRAGDTFLCYPGGEPSWRFLELRNGIVVAEKVRLLQEAGRLPSDFAEIAKLFDVKSANDNTSDFRAIRQKAVGLVNRP